MARPVYTVLLGVVIDSAATSYTFGPVPAGDTWVVRDITAYLYSAGAGVNPADGFFVESADTGVFWGTGFYRAQSEKMYHWDGRQVIAAGDSLIVACRDAGWYIRCTGYQLTAT